MERQDAIRLGSPYEEAFTVVSWNILLDKTRSKHPGDHLQYVVPQLSRVPFIANTLQDLPVPLDVVGLSEVHLDNGAQLAHMLGHHASHWEQHNEPQPGTKKGRKDEYVGLFGNKVSDTVDVLELGDHRRAVIVRVGSVAVAMTHLRSETWGKEREKQMARLLDHLENDEKAVIMGDFNALWFEKVRRNIRRAGFEPAFEIAGKSTPATYPAPGYEGVVTSSRFTRLSRRPRNIDQIYGRGVGVRKAARFSGDSDHFGLWATIEP